MSDQLPHDEELRSLYRRLPADEPRAEIDEAILSAARALADPAAREPGDAASSDTAGREHEVHRRRFLARARWMLPIAAAASVILTVTLTRLTPEQPAVAPSELRESSDTSVAYGTAAPEAHEEGDAAVVDGALEDAAPGSATSAARQRSESPPPAAPSPAPAQKPAAQKPAAEKPAEQQVAPQPRVAAPAAPSAPPASGAGATAPAEPLKKESADQLKSLGYLDGGAAPAPPAESAPPAAAAPASPPVAAMASRDDAESDEAGEDHASAKDEALAERAQARGNATTPKNNWPFGLAPGLDAAQACRSLERVLGAPCRYVDGVAVVQPPKPVVIDRGELMDGKATRVTLFAPGGTLTKVALRVEGFTTEQILVAPPAP